MKKFYQITVFAVSLALIILVFAMIPTVAEMIPAELANLMLVSRPPLPDIPSVPVLPDEVSEEVSEEISVDLTDAKFVEAINLCWYDEGDEPTLDVQNSTAYDINLKNYASSPYAFPSTSHPTVLIVHTHGTECYLPKGVDYYFEGEEWRSDDPSVGVVAVGEALKNELEKNGINVIHDTTMYDAEGYDGAYAASRKGVAAQLNSDVVMVIDLHRDSVFTSTGESRKPLCIIDGKECAQVMPVVGTDSVADHPAWRRNLTLAAHLAEKLGCEYPLFCRPICVRKATYNQDLHPGYLIIEVGACGNTVEEAENASIPLGRAIAELIKGTNPARKLA